MSHIFGKITREYSLIHGDHLRCMFYNDKGDRTGFCEWKICWNGEWEICVSSKINADIGLKATPFYQKLLDDTYVALVAEKELLGE